MASSAKSATMAFRPEVFFLGRTRGAGVVRDIFGRVTRRCRITTVGDRMESYGAIRLEEILEFDDGETDVWRWAMADGGDGRFVAAERSVGTGIIGRCVGDDYVLSFRRPTAKAKGLAAPRYHTTFTMLTPRVAMKVSRITILAAPVAVLTATHERIVD